MVIVGARIYLQNENNAAQYFAAVTSVTEVNATYTLGVNDISAGSAIGNSAVTTFAVVNKVPYDLGTFSGSTISDNVTVKAALQALELLDATQADVDQNESDADAAIALKLDASAVSTFGGTLVDDADAAAARTTLGLGSAATTASTDYATAAQGVTADAALPAAGAQAALSVDHLITLSGVAEAADDLGTFSGSTISDSGTVKAALQELETALESSETDVSGATSDIADIRSVTGTLDGSTHLGNFSGSIITDGIAIKTALQELSNAIEATQSDVDTNEADADTADALRALLDGSNIPGPYNNDTDAGNAGVAVGAIYKNSNGTIHWRVS